MLRTLNLSGTRGAEKLLSPTAVLAQAGETGWFGFQQLRDLADKLYCKVHFPATGLIASYYFLMAVP